MFFLFVNTHVMSALPRLCAHCAGCVGFAMFCAFGGLCWLCRSYRCVAAITSRRDITARSASHHLAHRRHHLAQRATSLRLSRHQLTYKLRAKATYCHKTAILAHLALGGDIQQCYELPQIVRYVTAVTAVTAVSYVSSTYMYVHAWTRL